MDMGGGSRLKRPGPRFQERGRGGKKPKRSKAFWQQRKTATIAQIPDDDNDQRQETEEEDDDEEDEKGTDYNQMIAVFAKKSSHEDKAIESEQEEDSDDEEEEEEELEEEEGSEEEGNEEEGEEEEIEEKLSSQGEEDSEVEEAENDLDQLESEEEEEHDSVVQDLTGSLDDPFVIRHECEIGSEWKTVLENRSYENQLLRWSRLGRIGVQTPQLDRDEEEEPKAKKKLLLLDAESDSAELQRRQKKMLFQKLIVNKDPSLERGVFLKQQLLKNLSSSSTSPSPLSPFQNELFSVLNSYRDLYFPDQTHDNKESIRLTYCLHALNHVLKTRTKILANNTKLKEATAETKAAPPRDQGLCRPKVLMVVPFRESAHRYVGA